MIASLTTTYLGFFRKQIDKKRIRLFVESDPDYPSVFCILKTLRYVGLKMNTWIFNVNELDKIKVPFFLHLTINGKGVLVIARHAPDGQSLEIYNPNKKKWETKSRQDVEKVWNGLVIYATEKPLSPKRDYITPLGCSLVIVAIVMMACYLPLWLPVAIGAMVSILLCVREEEMISTALSKICNMSKVTDCEKVEASSYSKLFGLRLDLIATSYFLSQLFIFIVFGVYEKAPVATLYFVSVFAVVPCVAYSVYGQIKARAVCPFCLMILFCLVAESVIYLMLYNTRIIDTFVLTIWVIFFSLFLLALISWAITKTDTPVGMLIEIELLKLKRRPEVIKLESTEVGNVCNAMWFGHKRSATVITTFLAPGCRHCRNTIREMIRLLNRGYIFRWNIVLGKLKEKDNEQITEWVARYFQERKGLLKILDRYARGYRPFIGKDKQIQKHRTQASAVVKKFEATIDANKITGFPRIIVNGNMLGSIYDYTDLEYIILDKN